MTRTSEYEKEEKRIESEYSQRNKTEQLSTIARQRKDFCSATYGIYIVLSNLYTISFYPSAAH